MTPSSRTSPPLDPLPAHVPVSLSTTPIDEPMPEAHPGPLEPAPSDCPKSLRPSTSSAPLPHVPIALTPAPAESVTQTAPTATTPRSSRRPRRGGVSRSLAAAGAEVVGDTRATSRTRSYFLAWSKGDTSQDSKEQEEEPSLPWYRRLPSPGNDRLGTLHPGAVYEGTQRNGDKTYAVRVEMVLVDLCASKCVGYLLIKGLTPQWPSMTTCFDGELVDPDVNQLLAAEHPVGAGGHAPHTRRVLPRSGVGSTSFPPSSRGNAAVEDETEHLPSMGYGLVTAKWEASVKDDREHWSRFRPWRQLIGSTPPAPSPHGFVFMRWKERFLVPDHRVGEGDIQGASYAGFYYVCVEYGPSFGQHMLWLPTPPEPTPTPTSTLRFPRPPGPSTTSATSLPPPQPSLPEVRLSRSVPTQSIFPSPAGAVAGAGTGGSSPAALGASLAAPPGPRWVWGREREREREREAGRGPQTLATAAAAARARSPGGPGAGAYLSLPRSPAALGACPDAPELEAEPEAEEKSPERATGGAGPAATPPLGQGLAGCMTGFYFHRHTNTDPDQQLSLVYRPPRAGGVFGLQ